MELLGISLNIATLILLTFSFLFFKNYIPSYFGKKGENLATKEDIGEITDRIESVKTLYSTQLEEIRSKISTARLEREEYQKERKECALKFYDLAIEMMYEKLAANFGDFPMDQGQSLANFQRTFFELVSSLLKCYQRIVIYFEPDHELRVGAEKVLNQALSARMVMKVHFGDLKLALMDEYQAFASKDEGRAKAAAKATNYANEKYWNRMHPVSQEFQKSLGLYLTALNEFLRPGQQIQIPKGMLLNDAE